MDKILAEHRKAIGNFEVVEIDQLVFEVLEVERRRITKVRVHQREDAVEER